MAFARPAHIRPNADENADHVKEEKGVAGLAKARQPVENNRRYLNFCMPLQRVALQEASLLSFICHLVSISFLLLLQSSWRHRQPFQQQFTRRQGSGWCQESQCAGRQASGELSLLRVNEALFVLVPCGTRTPQTLSPSASHVFFASEAFTDAHNAADSRCCLF